MTLATVAQALAQGHTISKVIKSILLMNTPLSKAIKEAMKQGYNEDQIGEYLEKGKSQSYSQRNQMLQGMTEEEKARGILYRQPKSEKNIGNIIKSAAMAAPAAIAGYAAAPALGATLARAAPQIFGRGAIPGAVSAAQGMTPNQPMSPGPTSPGVQVLGQGNNPIQNQPLGQGPQTSQQSVQSPQQPPVNQVTPNIAQLPQSVQPEVKGINVGEILSKHDTNGDVSGMLKANHPPESISGFLRKFRPKIAKAIEKETGQSLEKVIEQYAKNVPDESQEHQNLESSSKELDQGKPEAERPKIEKSSTVSTPQGIGEVREIRNGKAIVDVNGKIHKIDEQDLEPEPEEIKSLDLDSAVQDYLSRIPESHKSSVIDVSLYDPQTQELQVRFPSGEQWVYGPIPEEIFEKINSMTGIPVSSGESKLRGTIWEKGVEGSAGADFYKLIKKMVREGKVKERKLKTGIDLFKGFTRGQKRK
jgi:hypothetical protein